MPCSAISIPAALTLALGPNIDTNYLTLISNAEFMCQTRGYLIDDMLIGTYRELVAGQLAKALGYLSTAIVTAWLIVQGFMIVSGTNKTPLMTLMIQTIKIVGIMVVVSILAGNSPWIAEMVLSVQGLITAAIVGGGTDIYQIVDMNLAVSQIFNAVIEGLVGGQQSGADGNTLTKMAGVIGQTGPAVLVSIMAIMAEISITLAIMLAPLFIFFLMFKQTSSMFATWLKFLLGTMVSFALLTLLSSILLDMMMLYGAAVIAAFYANGALAAAGVSVVSFDISGSAMQLAALGSLSTALLLMVPPLIMQFFNSGASFATGAMMGMMGGGAAGMGAAGVLNAMSGQGGQGALGASGLNGTNGAAGQPGVGYSGASGASQNVGSRSVLQALMARSGQSGENSAGLNAPGTRGLANQESQGGQGSQFAAVQSKQANMGGELRSGSNVSSPVAAKSSGGASSYGSIEDAQIKADYSLGRGGHLPVGGDAPSVGSQVPLNGPSKSAASGNEYAGPVVPAVGSSPPLSPPPPPPSSGGSGSMGPPPPPPPGGSGASAASSASASSGTPVHSAAPVQSDAGSRSTGRAASLPYGRQRR